MIIDFHVHGKITSTFPFDEEKFLLTINEAKEYRLDSLAITEHCGSNNFLEGYEFLKSNYNRIGDYYDIDGFKVFYGMEVTTKQDLDILFIGKAELVLELREKINYSLKADEYIDINDLFELDIPDELLIILAHPYRDHVQFPQLERHVIEKLDAVELNSKDVYKTGIEGKHIPTIEEINEEWQHIKNENIQDIQLKILAIDDNVLIVEWFLKQNNQEFDGIYEIKFNDNLECIYFKSWEMENRSINGNYRKKYTS